MEQLSLFSVPSLGDPIPSFFDLWNCDCVFYDPYFDGFFIFCSDLKKVVISSGRRVYFSCNRDYYYFDEYLFSKDNSLRFANVL